MNATYVLYTPAQGSGALGGVVRIKTGTLTSAYIGFASEVLAMEFCTRSKIGAPTIVVDLRRVGSELPSFVEENFIVRFPDKAALDAYFEDRGSFPSSQFMRPVAGEHAA